MTYTSNDETIATVDANGLVTAVNAGTATITATSPNGKTTTCEITVTGSAQPAPTATPNTTPEPTPAAALDVTPGSGTPEPATTPGGDSQETGETETKASKPLITVKNYPYSTKKITLLKGKKAQISCTVLPESAAQGTIYASDKTSVATVNESGQISAKSAGTAKITATSKDSKKTAAITVKVVTKKKTNKVLKLKKRAVTLNKKGASAQIEIKKLTAETTDTIAYKVTSGKANISVDAFGKIICKAKPSDKAKQAAVRVSCGKKTATVKVTVKK